MSITRRSPKPPPGRRKVRAIQERGAAGHPGPACGPVAVGQATDDAGERHARPWQRSSTSPVPKGMRKLNELMTLVDADESIPKQAKQAITGLHDYCEELNEGIETFEPRSLRLPGTRPPAAWRPSPASVDHRIADRGDGGRSVCSKRRASSPPGSAWCRRRIRPAARRASVGSLRRATGKSAGCWCWAPRQWSPEPTGGTTRPAAG